MRLFSEIRKFLKLLFSVWFMYTEFFYFIHMLTLIKHLHNSSTHPNNWTNQVLHDKGIHYPELWHFEFCWYNNIVFYTLVRFDSENCLLWRICELECLDKKFSLRRIIAQICQKLIWINHSKITKQINNNLQISVEKIKTESPFWPFWNGG